MRILPFISLLFFSLPTLSAESGTAEHADISAENKCMSEFKSMRHRVSGNSSQSVIVQSDSSGINPYVSLHHSDEQGQHYTLWQTLNGDIRGYALRNDRGFDYVGNIMQPLSLNWHPTLIWDKLFASDSNPENYSCVLTGRTRIMGKKVSLLRLVPAEGLRYSYLIAKDDDSDFPVELSVLDSKGNITMRLTTMESRIIIGMDFPISDEVFDSAESKRKEDALKRQENAELQEPVIADRSEGSAGLTVSDPAGVNECADGSSCLSRSDIWHELNIPEVFSLSSQGRYPVSGPNCIYQEFTDGLTSFRVYRNDPVTIYYPVLNNTTLTVLRRNTIHYEYTVVGEIPLSLAEFVLNSVAQR